MNCVLTTMKNMISWGIRLSLLIFFFINPSLANAQSAGFNTTFIVINNGSSDIYYDLQATTGNTDFNGANLGTFCQGATSGLTFKGAEHNVYKCGGCDLTSTRIYYRIYVTGSPSGSFVSNNINYSSGSNNGCGGQDQQWKKIDYNTNLLNGLSGGNYTIEVYSDASVTCSGGTIYASNSGNNYKATFTVLSTVSYGTITSGDQTICSGGDPSNITLSSAPSGGSGSFSYQWYYQDGIVACPSGTSTSGWTSISGATSSSYDPPSGLTGSRTYALMVDATGSPDCGVATWASSCRKVTVLSAFNSGSINSTGETICNGGTPSQIGSTAAASGGDGSITYSWRSSADGYTAAIGGATSATYTPPAGLTSTTSYRRYAKDGTCNTTPTVSSGTWTVTVRSAFSTGTISSTGETICNGGTPSQIGSTAAASGGDGSITYSWRSSADGYTAAIGGATSATYTPPAGLTSTTSYQRYAKDGTCNTSPTVSSGTWTVTVTTTTTTIAPTATQNISVSTNGTALTVSEGTNSVSSRVWKYGTSSGSYPSSTGITTTTYTPNFGSVGTYYVVCVTTYGSPCNTTVTSNEVIINVTSNSITTGSVTGSPYCVGTTGVSVPFTYSPTSSFASSTFTAELSDASGSFASPTTLQNVSSDGSGSQSISVTIPSVTEGTGYRIRVVSNSPAVNGTDNGSNLTIKAVPTTANAGADQTSNATCGLTSVTLAANSPTVGTGAWSVVSGSGGSFGNSSSPTSTFSGTAGTTYTLRWTISNSPCTASTDDVVITFNQNPTTASVGSTQNICGSLTSSSLGGNTPSVGTGAWSIVSGGTGTFSNSASGSSTFTADAYGTYVLRWTISNSPCTASTADITVNYYQTPTTASVGSTQNVCGLTSSSLGGNSPSVGTGGWSIVSGGTGSFSNTTSGSSTFTADAYGTYVLRWTISNGTCTASTADITVNYYQTPTTASVGSTQNVCGLTSSSLGGNTPSVGTGAWSIVSGGTGTFSNSISGSSTFTADAYGTYVLRWTISNGTCTASTANITVNYYQTPTTASVGSTQNVCGLTSSSLGGNTPSVGTGAWSIVSGGTGTFSNSTSGSSTFTADAYGTYVLRWTISNGTCTASTADITVNYYQTPTTASVGSTQNICGSLTSSSLGGNTPSVGTGAWSIVSGGTGTFSNSASGSSTFTADAYGTYVLRWTISNGTCTASTADITVNYYQTPTTASVGSTQNICGSLTSSSLGGNTPSVGTGAWSIVSGGTGTFSNSASGSSTFTANAYGTYVLRWTISNGTCTASTANITVNYYQTPTTATVGSNQTVCSSLVSGSLGGNTPSVGTGAWSIVSGGTGTFSNSASGSSTFTANAYGTYVLRWTISNGTCTASTADITVVYASSNTWVGGTSTNWNTAANWSCGTVPTTSIDVIIPSGTTFSPNISSATANAKSVTINSGATLTMSGGQILNIASSGSLTNDGTFTAGDGTVVFAGTGTVNGSVAVTFNNLTVNGVTTLTTVPTVNGILTVNNTSATISQALTYGSSSTLVYAVNFDASTSNFWTATTDGAAGTGRPNNVTINSGVTLTFPNAARAMAGSLTCNGAYSVTNQTSQNLILRGDFINNGTTQQPGQGTITFSGAGTQTINGSVTNMNLYNLVVNSGATLTLGRDVRFVDYSGTAGTTTLSGTVIASTYQFTTNGTGTHTFNLNGILRTANTNGLRNGTSGTIGANNITLNIGSSSTVDYNATVSQTVNALNYANLTISGSRSSATVTLASGTVGISGTFSVTATGTSYSTTGNTVDFNGSADQTTSAFTFNNLTLSAANSDLNLGGAVTVNGTLTLTNGKVILGANNLTVGSASVSGASSSNYVVTNSTGYLVLNSVGNTNVLFPVGNSTANYAPATINNTGTSDNFSVRVGNTVSNASLDNTRIVNLQWTILEAVAGNSASTVRFQWNNADEAGSFNRSGTVQIGQWGGSAYNAFSSTVTVGPPHSTVSATGAFNSFGASSPFIIGNIEAFCTIASEPTTHATWGTPTNVGAGRMTLNWTNGNGSNRIVVAKAGSAPTGVPADGSTYTANAAYGTGGTALGDGFVVYNGSGNSVTVTGLTSGTTYYYKIFEYNGSGCPAGGLNYYTGGTPANGSQVTSSTYITTQSGDWNTSSTWLDQVVPPAGASVTINNTAVTVTGTVSNNPVNITINSGKDLSIGVSGSLTATGTITNNGTMSFSGAGSVTTASFVNSGSGSTLSWSAAGTLNISAGGTLTNNTGAVFTRGTGIVNFNGAGTINGTSAITFNNLYINTGAVTVSTVPVIDGTLRINGGNLTAAPIYTSNSTLYYNVSYGRYVEWNAVGTGTLGTTPGYPNNVTINTGTFNVYNSASGEARSMDGTLTVNSGATFDCSSMDAVLTIGSALVINSGGTFSGGTMSQNTNVGGSVTNNGTLTLSTVSGGNLKTGGDWIVGSSATQTNNQRYVSFNGASGNQTITKTGGGDVYFDVLVVDKAAGSVVVSSSPATNIVMNHNAGNVFRIINTGNFDLNGRKITFNNDNGSIYVDGVSRTITSAVSGASIEFNGYKNVVNNAGAGSLSIGSNVTVNLNANGNVDFGASMTTINGVLSLNSTTSCFVNTNPPIYGTGSTLVYNTGANYGRSTEWNSTSGAGYPYNVTVASGSSVNVGNTVPGTARQIAGNLTVNGGFYMDYGADDMTASVTVLGNVVIGSSGTLSLSDVSGGDLNVRGNWTNSGGSFNPKGRAVFFNGTSGDQTITKSGGEIFDFIIINKSAGAVLLANDITANQTLTFTSGKITTSSNKVIISSTGGISGGSSTSYINGNLQRHFATGSSVARAYPIGDASAYAPVTITMGTSSTAGSILLSTTGADHPNIGTFGLSATKYVKRYWSATNVGAVFSNTSIEFNYVVGDLQGSGTAANMKAARYTTGTGWTYPTTSGATTYKFTAGGITNSNLQNDYTAGECGGTISFTPSNNGPLCVGSTLNLLSGTVTGNIGSVGYSWSGPSGFTSTTQNPSVSNAQTTNGGTYTLTVTDAAGCSNSNTTTVVVNSGPTTSNAGPDQTKCNDGNFTLAGNNPGSGTGLWTVVSGTATITTPTAYNSTVTGVPAGTSATLRWTVSNSPCTPSSDDVVLANNALPTTANAGADQTLCNTSTFTMAGNNPTSGTGLWSIISGSATITNASLYNTTVTGVAAGASVTLRWTISNGICSNSTDDVVISNNALPTTAAAGSDQEQCNNGSFTLAGNTPTTGTGAWTVVSGTATITSPSSPTSSVTGVPLGTSATLRWSISNGVCTPSTDDVVLTNSYPPDVANAGTDQANCQSGNFTLAGNNPSSGTGTWTVISGTATITTPSAYNSTVTGVPAGTSATLRWTITNGTCTPTTDDVVLTNSNPPTTANAGSDQSGCSSGTVTLAGNTPSSGTGTWTIQSGGSGTFSNANSASSTFSAAAGTYVLRWTISTAGCTASYDEATITIVNSPTTANAGADISQCNNSTFTMAGNTPVYGTGTWTVTSGSATITSPNSPTSTVTVSLGNTATLRWTIANAPCTDSWDEVILSNSAANLWVGNTSSDWNTGSNWSCGVVPVAGSSITIPSGRPNNPNIGLSGANASIKDLTIDAGATLTMSSSYTLTFATGGTFTNNGTFTPGNGTIIFSGTGTVAGSSNSTFNNVTINGGVDFGNGKSTINGTLQINSGGYVNTNAPKYGASSTLAYNVSGAYGRNLEWSASGTGTIGTTTGYPNNVVVSNNTVLQMGANSGTGTARSLEGNLTVESGSTFSMSAGGAMTQPVTVKGNVTIDGTLALSTSAGGDMNVGGNWTVGANGTQTNNGRSVQFNSSTNATQTVTKTGGGTVYFDYLNVNNTATNGKLMLSSSPATQLRINSTTNSTSSYQLQLTNGDLDLNGQTFEMNGSVPNSTNIQVSNGIRKITGSTGSSISITGTATAGTPNLKVYPSTGTDKLVIDGGASLQTSVGVVFTNTTFNGIFQINQHGFVAGSSLSTDPPVYGTNATLIYNNGINGFNRNYEWTTYTGTLGTTPGYPNNIIVKGTTPLDIANTGVSSGVRELGVAGSIEIQSGSSITMSAMNYPLTVNGNIQLDGTLILSTNASGILNLAGNWERGTSGTFTQNSRTIRFFGTATQTINATGGETFTYITVDKTADKVSLISNLTVTNTIAIDNGTFDVSTGALVINDVITKGAGGSLISEETGTVVYDKTSSSQSVIYAEYGNLTLSNASAKSLANNLAIRGDFTVSGGAVTPGTDIRFSGNRDQAIAGLLNYSNMAFSGTGNYTKRFTGDATFSGAMTFTGGVGTVDLDGSGDNLNFTIKSDANATARIANVNSWVVSGKAIAERYIPSQRKWRLISIPVTGETIRQSLTRQADGTYPAPVCFGSTAQGSGSGTLLTGHSFSSCDVAVANGFDHVVTGGLSSIRYYNPAQSNPWASATSTPNILAAPSQPGYLVFIRGDRNQLEVGSSETTLRPKGYVKQNDQTISISAPFVVLGNPYASPIHLDQLYDFTTETNKNTITRNFWIWDADLNTSYGGVGGYRYISANVEGSEITSYTAVPSLPEGTTIDDYLMVNSGQGVMVQRRNTGTLTVKESYKYSSSGNTYPFRIKASTVSLFRIDLYRATGNTLEIMMDGTAARFGDEYNKVSNEVYDIYKTNQFEENISLVRDNNYLAIESRPIPTSNDTLYVPFYFTTNRGYALKFKTEYMAGLNLSAVLQDAFTATETQVPMDGSEFVYPFSVTTAAGSKALNRFRVVFRPGSVTPVIDLFADKGINIYPNPVLKGETMNLQFKNKSAGKYLVTLYDAVGVRVFSKTVVHTGGNGVQKIELPKRLASGTYFAELTDGKGNQGKMKVIIQ